MESAWPHQHALCMSAPCPTCSPSPLWLLHECPSSTVTASVRTPSRVWSCHFAHKCT